MYPHRALDVENVSKHYGQYPVLRDVNLVVEPGEFVALTGLNGAGKTTLFKCILDFCNIDTGAIQVFGIERSAPAARKSICFLPERFGCPAFATGREFLNFITRLHGNTPHEADLQAVLTALDLPSTSLSSYVSQLSKGTAQKLGLAATLLSAKPFLILDEPMSGLDPKARTLFKRHLIACKSQGLTLLFSTHLLADVETLCDRIAVLHSGVIRYTGTPRELRAKYDGISLEDAFVRIIEGEER